MYYRITLFFLITAFCQCAYAADQSEEKAILVLDASGSMWGQIEGKSKIEIARDAVSNLLSSWTAERELGLIAYGHRRKGDCEDIETLIPVGPLDAGRMSTVVSKIKPKGKTPLTAAVKKAAEELKFTENKATVILLSDGIETCDLDPCKVGSSLEQLGVDFTAHVIGFDISNSEDQEGLKCLAENTGGMFISAANAEELHEALQVTAALPSPSPSASVSPSAKPSVSPSPSPEAKVTGSFDAPDSAIKGSEIEITYSTTEELNQVTYIYLYFENNEKHVKYATVYKSNTGEILTTKLRLPSKVGKYNLIWKTKMGDEIFKKELEIKDTELAIVAEDTATAGTNLEIGVKAESGLSGYIYLHKAGVKKHLSYVNVRPGRLKGYEVGSMRMPLEVGEYELKWKTSAGELLATKKLALVEATASITAPSTATGGTNITITPTATDGLSGYIYLKKKGAKKHIKYVRVVSNPQGGYKDANLVLPTDEGEYVLSWLTNRKEELATAAIIVEKPGVRLEVPSTSPKGMNIEVSLSAPEGMSGYFYLYKEGKKKHITYSRLVSDPKGGYKPATVRLPAIVGSFTITFQTQDREQLARETITTTEIKTEILAPDQVSTEDTISIELDAPSGLGGYVYLHKEGSKKSIMYRRVYDDAIKSYKTISIPAPDVAGKYELRWQNPYKEVLAVKSFQVQ